LIEVVREKRAAGECLNGPRIRAIAVSIAEAESILGFSASEGWLMRFLYRHHLVLRLVIEKFSICKIKHNLFNAHVFNI
jgi:hypothetical protein